jgi:hypothetical protein
MLGNVMGFVISRETMLRYSHDGPRAIKISRSVSPCRVRGIYGIGQSTRGGWRA